MDKYEFDYKHYVIVQKIEHLKTMKNYVSFSSNVTHLKQLVNSMVGDVKMFLYNPDDNSRKKVTSKFRDRTYNFKTLKYENIILANVVYIAEYGPPPEYYNFYFDKGSDYFPSKKFYILGNTFRLKDEYISYECRYNSLFYTDLEQYKKKQTFGKEYEKFIAKKYEDTFYYVELNGIKKGVSDGGIDLIAIKDDKIILVQCKNWSLLNNYKINQKDIRAFIGDCYLYLLNTNIKDRKVAYHFIVSHHDILTKSAEIFLKKNNLVKFKVVPFEN